MESYIRNVSEFPELHHHFMSWYNSSLSVPIAFVRYEDLSLPSTERDLKTFLDFEGHLGIVDSFRPRRSNENVLSEELLNRVREMFSDLIEIQQTLPSVYVIEHKNETIEANMGL